MREIIATVQRSANGTIPKVAQLISDLSPSAASLLTESFAEEKPIPNPEQQFADLVVRLRNRHLDRELVRLRQRLADPRLTETEAVTMLAEQQRLRGIKRTPML